MLAELSRIRNIGVAAHIDAGKTTTTERILFYAGCLHKSGDVDDGDTTTDFDDQERERGITIFSAAVTFPWREHSVNLIDTPGHVDFTAEVERSLRVLDGMVAVFDAKEGVEAQSETVWRQADHYKVPRICFVNKMDRLGADFQRSVQSIRDRLHARPLVLQLPIGQSSEFQGVVDLIEMKALRFDPASQGATILEGPVPDDMAEACARARQELLEAVGETSEDRMNRYLGEEPFSPQEIRQAIREMTVAHERVPVLCGSALHYVGVQPILDAAVDYLPSPLDVPPVIAPDPQKPKVQHSLRADPKEPFAGLVFKIVAEKPVDLYYVRIYSGILKGNARVLNCSTNHKENISRIFRMFAKRRDALDEAGPGEIVAVVGPKQALTGHTLSDPRRPVLLESIEFPETVISASIEPKSSRDHEKLQEGLRALIRQDPTLRVTTDEETGQTLLSGMGELHLEVMVRRLRNDLHVEAMVGKPRVSYRETVSRPAEGHGIFERNIGGQDHYAEVRLRLAPGGTEVPVATAKIIWETNRDVLTADLANAVEQGIRDACLGGVLAAYPVINCQASILEVRAVEQRTSTLAMENATRNAFHQAMEVGAPQLLEPVMDVNVITPDEYCGPIINDLNARGGEVTLTTLRGADRAIQAHVPLSQMFGYVTKLRSLSHGRATASMSPSHYAPVPPAEMKSLLGT